MTIFLLSQPKPDTRELLSPRGLTGHDECHTAAETFQSNKGVLKTYHHFIDDGNMSTNCNLSHKPIHKFHRYIHTFRNLPRCHSAAQKTPADSLNIFSYINNMLIRDI